MAPFALLAESRFESYGEVGDHRGSRWANSSTLACIRKICQNGLEFFTKFF